MKTNQLKVLIFTSMLGPLYFALGVTLGNQLAQPIIVTKYVQDTPRYSQSYNVPFAELHPYDREAITQGIVEVPWQYKQRGTAVQETVNPQKTIESTALQGTEL